MRNLYRFEIVRELGRDGSNVVYEARDPLNAARLHLLEWTPSSSEWSKAAAALSEIGDVPGGEVFSNSSSFYLVVAPHDVNTALGSLNARDLFNGNWPGADAVASPATAVATVAPPVVESRRPMSAGPLRVTAAIGVLVLIVIGLWLLPRGLSSDTPSSTPSRPAETTRAEVPRAPTPPPPPTYEELIAKAAAAENGQNFGDAIAVAIQARDLDPVRLDAHEMLTRLYAKSGDEDRAFESAKEFLKGAGSSRSRPSTITRSASAKAWFGSRGRDFSSWLRTGRTRSPRDVASWTSCEKRK